MRLAFYYRDYLHGGAYPRDTRLLAHALAKRVEHVFIYCCTVDPAEQGEHTTGNVTTVVQYVPARRWSLDVVNVPRGLRERLHANRDRVDLVTLIGAFIPENYPVARLLRRRGIPYAVSPGEPINAFALRPRGVLRWLRKRIYATWFERDILEHAAAIQVCSGAHLVNLLGLGFRVDPAVAFVGREAIDWEAVHAERGDTPSPAAPAPAATRPTPARPAPPDAPHFGYLGRLRVFHKGLDLLLEAWGMYKTLGGPGRLTLVGPASDAERATLTRLCRRQHLSDVEILPPEYGRDKFTYLESLSALVHPSRHDGITRVIREGIASGCVLITTHHTHVYELLDTHHAGYVVGLDAFQLARAMRAFADRTPAEHDRLQKGVAAVARDLNWEAGATQFLDGLHATTGLGRHVVPGAA